MSGLLELQRAFHASLFDPEARAVESRIAPDDLPAAARMSVYRNNMLITLREALAALYPVVLRLVGDDYFAVLARAFVHEHPSRAGNLHGFGRAFPAWLRGADVIGHVPCIADVASLEWAVHEAFHAADTVAPDPGALDGGDDERFGELRAGLQPACRLLESAFPVDTIWAAHQGQAEPEPIDLDTGPAHVLVLRPSLEVAMYRPGIGVFRFLQAVQAGASLAQATERALEVDDEFDLNDHLSGLVVGGVIAWLRWLS